MISFNSYIFFMYPQAKNKQTNKPGVSLQFHTFLADTDLCICTLSNPIPTVTSAFSKLCNFVII